MLTIEGPRFSSKAESKLWHSWGAHTVNMTTVPEVKHISYTCEKTCLCISKLAYSATEAS